VATLVAAEIKNTKNQSQKAKSFAALSYKRCSSKGFRGSIFRWLRGQWLIKGEVQSGMVGINDQVGGTPPEKFIKFLVSGPLLVPIIAGMF
jgi:hypothetical protein